jgi:hypothetical protein
LASRSTTRSWLPARRLGEDVLRLRDGSLRAVLECGRPPAMPGSLLGILRGLQHRTQIVVQARRPPSGDSAPVKARLRASHASLMSGLLGSDIVFLRRLLVVVPSDPDEDGGGPAVLNARVEELKRALARAGLDLMRVIGEELDAIGAPDAVHEGRCEVRVGRQLARTLITTRLPERLRTAVLGALTCEHDLSLHVQPLARVDRVDLSAYVTLWAETRDSLDLATERAEALLAADGVRLRRPYLQAEPALASGLPLGLDLAAVRRVLTEEQLRAAGASSLQAAEEHRLLYGIDPGTRKPLLLDRFSLSNPNAIVVGDVDARSRLLTLEYARASLAGRDVHLITGDGRYQRTLEALEGRRVVPSAFDPFPLASQDDRLESRVRLLLAVIELMAGGLTAAEVSAVEDAIAFAYAAHGYRYEANDEDLLPPTLDEIRTALLRRGAAVCECAQAEVEAVAAALARYTGGTGRRLLEGRRQTRPFGPLSVQDLAPIPEEDQPVAALLSLDRLFRSEPPDRRPLIVLDDAHRVLAGQAGRYVASLMAGAGKCELGLTLATSDIGSILHHEVRDAVLDAGLTVLLRQTSDAVERAAEAFRLTPAEQSWLLRASVDEGLLITDGHRLAFRAIASDEEERLTSGGNS